jgi:hypothetical protein
VRRSAPAPPLSRRRQSCEAWRPTTGRSRCQRLPGAGAPSGHDQPAVRRPGHACGPSARARPIRRTPIGSAPRSSGLHFNANVETQRCKDLQLAASATFDLHRCLHVSNLLICWDARRATSPESSARASIRRTSPRRGNGLAFVGSSDADEIASLSMPNCHAHVGIRTAPCWWCRTDDRRRSPAMDTVGRY